MAANWIFSQIISLHSLFEKRAELDIAIFFIVMIFFCYLYMPPTDAEFSCIVHKVYAIIEYTWYTTII